MQRTLQRADAGDDRRVDIGERRGGDAGRKGGGVELVIGMQRQRDIHRADLGRVRTAAEQHVEEVRRMTHRRIRRDRSAALLHAAPRRDDARDLPGEPNGFAIGRRQRIVVRVGIVMAERGGQRPQRVHAVGGRQHLHQPQDRLGQRPRGGELRLQIAELGAIRQPAVPQQVAGLFKGRVAREVVNVVAAIRQHAAIAVEKTNARRGRDDVFETALWFLRRCHIRAILSLPGRRLVTTVLRPIQRGRVLRSTMRHVIGSVVIIASSAWYRCRPRPEMAWPQFRGPSGRRHPERRQAADDVVGQRQRRVERGQ